MSRNADQRKDMDVNNGEAGYDYPNKIRQVYLFGSLVNTAKEKVHDVDIYLVCDDDRKAMIEFSRKNGKGANYLDLLMFEQVSKAKYLQNRKKIYSIHANFTEPELLELIMEKYYILLFDDYKECPNAVEQVKGLSK